VPARQLVERFVLVASSRLDEDGARGALMIKARFRSLRRDHRNRPLMPWGNEPPFLRAEEAKDPASPTQRFIILSGAATTNHGCNLRLARTGTYARWIASLRKPRWQFVGLDSPEDDKWHPNT
jgi:hypothetical protein